jgi:hypothetical protein
MARTDCSTERMYGTEARAGKMIATSDLGRARANDARSAAHTCRSVCVVASLMAARA